MNSYKTLYINKKEEKVHPKWNGDHRLCRYCNELVNTENKECKCECHKNNTYYYSFSLNPAPYQPHFLTIPVINKCYINHNNSTGS